MSAEEKFEDEYESTVEFLTHDCGVELVYAEDLVNNLLAAYAGSLAAKVATQKLSKDMLLLDDTTIEGWRLGVNKSAALLRKEGSS
jgi:hypothetical protein